MGKFTDWIKNKLKVTRYPSEKDIIETQVGYLINVSCEHSSINQKFCMDNGIKYFWFPMDEVSNNIGLNSLFGALQILWIAEQENEKVILHCHGGVNRSPTVMESYYFLRTKKYLEKDNSRLLDNIERGHLPAKRKMESFLKNAEEYFLNQDWENNLNTESKLSRIKLKTQLWV